MLTFCLLVSASLHCHPHFAHVFFRIWLSFFPSQSHLHPLKTDMEPENSPLKRAKHWPKHQHFLGSIVRFFGGFTPQTWHPPVDGWNPANQLRLVVYPIIYEVYTSQAVQDFFHQPSHPHFAPFFNPQKLSRLLRMVEVFGYWSDYRWRPHVDRRWGIRSTGDVDEQKILGNKILAGGNSNICYFHPENSGKI